jgi:hypothetical protein
VHWLLVVLEPKVIPKVLEWCKDWKSPCKT